MAPIEQAGKVAHGIIDVMRGAPVILALLVVNICFIAFFSYLLGQIATNSRERNESQTKLIEKLVGDIRDCRSDRRSDLEPMAQP